jgi:hypothetical protein
MFNADKPKKTLRRFGEAWQRKLVTDNADSVTGRVSRA